MGIFNFSKSDRTDEVEKQNPQSEPQVQHHSGEQGGVDEVFSIPVKAGKRIYYFDVKTTRADDYYITITESRKKQARDGSFTIDKHKIHLYKEDFAKFADGFAQVVDYVKEHKPDFFAQEQENSEL